MGRTAAAAMTGLLLATAAAGSGWARTAPPTAPLAAAAAEDLPARQLAETIVTGQADDLKAARLVIDWLNANFHWNNTDYQKRTVDEIIAQRGGNCFEQARVARALLTALGVQTRGVAEINIQPTSDRREASSKNTMTRFGLSGSVYGRDHNDHRWIEVFDRRSGQWTPADPTLGLLGADQWIRARVGFDERITNANIPSRDMLAPIAIFAMSEDGNPVEDRSQYYLVTGFGHLYGARVTASPHWGEWRDAIAVLSPAARQAFLGQADFHSQEGEILKAKAAYLALKTSAGS